MKNYNENKICFIICTDNQKQLDECLMYLKLLEVPQKYEIEVLTVAGAKSMASGYNEAMNSSDARYKVYMHQDTFIIEKSFIKKILDIFKKDNTIGMIGVIGTEKLSKDGVMWHSQRCGNFYRLNENGNTENGNIFINKKNTEVEAIDGLLMVTREDIPWREDIFDGWDFYDVSQSMEFRKRGYKIIVPAQKCNWVIHISEHPNFYNYEKYREIFVKEYSDMIDGNYLRVLFLHSNMITLMGLPTSFIKLGHEVTIPKYEVRLNEYFLEDKERIEEFLEEGNYDLVCTYDFCPSVSAACQEYNVKYFSWVYDSPLLELYTEQALNECNYISVFDRKQYERMQERKIPHLYYLPLAAEVETFGNVVVTKKDERKYKADISFVGRLYNKRGFEEIFSNGEKKYLDEAEGVLKEIQCIWDKKTSLYDKVSDDLISFASSKESNKTWGFYCIDKRYYFESMRLARKCNEIERLYILNELSQKHQVVLYTDNTDKKILPKVIFKPWVDYWTEMPKVFYVSKINLNITSRSIESGIPQRIWDIMAVGGFCLTNYQPEIEEYFDIGKDIEVYYDLNDLKQKIEYYLSHEDERIQIAINGYKKVRDKHTLTMRVEKMLSYIFSNNIEGNNYMEKT